MIKELFKLSVRETSLHISQSTVEAVMKKKIDKCGCRVYADGYLGIAGTLGEPTASTWAQAEANLARKIPYPFEPEKNKQRVRDLRELKISDEEFVREMEDLLAIIRRENPDFIFSNKIKLIETEISLQNNAGLDYANYDLTVELALLVKHVDSVNIFDTSFISSSRTMEKEKIVQQIGEMLKAFNTQVQLPAKERMPVIIHPSSLLSKINESLNAEKVGLGASLFADKIGCKAFHETFSVYQDATDEKQHSSFFDMEGMVNPQDKVMLIEKGVILKPYTDKKRAQTFSLETTGSAGGSYDDVPSLGYSDLSIVPSEKTLQEILQGEQGIMVIMASGGDYTADGNFATPVQMSYLTDGKRLLGRLPELNISGHLYDIFGEDFVGVSEDKPLMGERALVARTKIN